MTTVTHCFDSLMNRLAICLVCVIALVVGDMMEGKMAWNVLSPNYWSDDPYQGLFVTETYTRQATPSDYIHGSSGAVGKILYDPVGQHLYSQSRSSIYVTDASWRTTLLPLPAQAQVVDYTLSLSTSTLVYSDYHESYALYSLPLTGGTAPTLVSSGRAEQVTIDPVSHRIYYSDSEYITSCNPDGSDSYRVFYVYDLPCTSPSIRPTTHVQNGTLFIPVSCQGDFYVVVLTPLGNYSSVQLDTQNYNSGWEMTNFFLEAGFLEWSRWYESGTNVTSFTYDKENNTIVVKETHWTGGYSAGFFVYLGATPGYEENAVALSYCHLSGSFNGTHCQCDAMSYGADCGAFCSERSNCLDGQCQDDGQCLCHPGYSKNPAGRCQANGYSPPRPTVYGTLYEESASPGDSNSTWWNYYSDTNSLSMSTRSATNHSVFQLKDYRQGWTLYQNGHNCLQEHLDGVYSSTLMPQDTLLITTGPCPRESNRTCQQWQSPNNTHRYWTTVFLNVSVFWQEEIEVKEANQTLLTRQYDLAHTNVTQLATGWRDTSGCPCVLSGGCYTASRSVTPSLSLSRSLSPSVSASLTRSSSTSPSMLIEYPPPMNSTNNSSYGTSENGWKWVSLVLLILLILLAVALIVSCTATVIFFRKSQSLAYEPISHDFASS